MSNGTPAAPALAQTAAPAECLRHPETPKSSGVETWRRAHTFAGAAAPAAVSGHSPALRDGAPAVRGLPSASVHGLSPALVNARAHRQHGGTPTTPAAPSPRMPLNPFECDDMMTSLSLPTSSPSLFDQVTSPNDKEEVGWAIEQIAQLDPANIDVDRFHRQLVDHDPHKEQQAQTAIDRFFNSEKIVPSPWSEGADRPQPKAQVTGYMESPLLATAAIGIRCDQAVQTTLSLPAELPPELEAMLAQYLCPDHLERGQLRDNDDSVLSNSTLRRKLLFHGAVAGDEPASNDVSMADADASLYHLPATPEHGHLQPSSPPSRRRHVSLPRHGSIESPPVSPICKSMLDSPSTSSIQSQGLAKIRYPSSDLSDVGDEEDADVLQSPADRRSLGQRRVVFRDGGGGAEEQAAADHEPASYLEEGAADTGYHSTLVSLPSLSARHLAAADDTQRLPAGSGCGSMLTSTRLEPDSVRRSQPGSPLSSTRLDEGGAAPPAAHQLPMESALEDDLQESTSQRPPVPIGSSTPSRAQVR